MLENQKEYGNGLSNLGAANIRHNYLFNKPNELYEPLNPEQKLRNNGIPVGLKNVGNSNILCFRNLKLFQACYVNSLLQIYFMSQDFVSAILNYNPDVCIVEEMRATVLSHKRRGDTDLKKRRIEASIEQVKNLRKLFALMIKSHKKYLDSTEVLKSVVDDMGHIIEIGDQKDVTEYHLNFLSRIEEAFVYQDRFLRNKKNNVERSSTMESSKILLSEDVPIKLMDSSIQNMKNSTVKQSNNGQISAMIKQHFFGRVKEYRSYSLNSKETIEQAEFLIGPIILDISNNKDLYSGLEKYCNATIDDFKAPNGEIIKAKQQLWIIEPPEFLVFQLNRVSFDTRYGMAYKINKKFQFEEEIYLDRFMHENKEEAIEITNTIKSLNEKLEKSEEQLQKLMTCFDSNFTISEVLTNAEGFLSLQLNAQLNQDEGEELPVQVLEDQSCTEEEVQTAMKVLREYKKSLEKKIELLSNNIAILKITMIQEEIKRATKMLSKRKYHLVAILMHAGDAGRGHYYSFIKNMNDESWKRFNDSNVTPETVDRVMREATGGLGNASAYCLVYLADHTIRHQVKTFNSSITVCRPNEILTERHYYNQFMPLDLLEYVAADNQAFYSQIDSYKFNSNLSIAISQYQWRYKLIERIASGKSSKGIPTCFDSFATFLKSECQTDRLLKWHILDVSLRETGCCEKLRELDSPAKVSAIQDRISYLPKNFALKPIILTNEEKDELDQKLAQYIASYPIIIYYKFMIKCFIESRWKDACYAARRILFMENKKQMYAFGLIRDIIKTVCLRLALKTEYSIKQNSQKEAEEISNYLVALMRGVLKSDDIHVAQVKTIINDSLNQVERHISQNDFHQLKQEAYKFSTGLYRTSELDKVIKDHKCENLEDEVEVFSTKDAYEWKDILNEGASYELAKALDDFKNTYHAFVQFHNMLLENKKVLSFEDRKNIGLLIMPKIPK